jgi:hypothetical protein
MWENRDADGALVGKPGEKRPFGRLRCRWADNIEWTLKKG